jgi:chemotaxis protein MotB
MLGRSACLLTLMALVAHGTGCVTVSKYDGVVDQRDALTGETRQLREQVRNLEVSNASLEEELESTLEQFEDLNIEHASLSKKASTLEASEAELSETLGARERQLAESRIRLDIATEEVGRLTSTYTSLMSDLEAEISSGQIEIEQLREGLRVNVQDDILFASGSARLDPIGRKVLGKVIAHLRKLDHLIEIQGHTDNKRIRGSLAKTYPSNWDLAAARASTVARLMQESGIAGERITVVSHASYAPLAPNDSDENRAQNRRIELRLKPRAAPANAASQDS